MLYNSEDLLNMIHLTKSDILHLAKLSGLTLTEKEVKELSYDLSSVISFFEELKETNTKNILPTSQTTGLENITRADKIDTNQTLSLEDVMYNANDNKNNLFKVPIILKK